MLAGAYPSDEFAELKPRVVWDRVDRRRRGPARRPGRGGDERRHDPGPRAVRRVHGRRGRDARPAGRRARRGDGLRAPGRDARRRHRPRREQLAGRGDRPRPGHRQRRRPGVPGKLPFWHGDAVGRPIELGRALGAFVARARGRPGPRASRAGAAAHRAAARARTTSTSSPPRTCSPTSRTSARPPAPCRPTGGSSSSASATSSATGGSCLLTPFGGRVHAPWSLALEARLGERLGARGPDDLVRRRDRDPPARGRRAARRHRGAAVPRSRRGRGPRRRPGRDVGAVREPVPRERGAGAAPAAPPARDADAALAAAPAGRRPARGRVALRQLPDPRRDVPRVPVGRLRPAGAARDPRRRRAARDRGPQRRDGPRLAVRELASCSTTSRPTCTTATRRWPSGGPAR